jgi:hypothetical protein
VSGTSGPFTPLHQVYPNPNFVASINASIVNYNIMSDPSVNHSTTLVYNLDLLVLSGLLSVPLIREAYPDTFDMTEPVSMVIEPIYSTFDEETSEIVGYIQSVFKWTSFFSQFNGEGYPILCTLENTCGDLMNVLIEEQMATLLDPEEATKIRMNDVNVSTIIGVDVDDITIEEALEAGICVYTLTVFPTVQFCAAYDLRTTLFVTIIGITMAVMVASFFAYDL